MKYKIYNQDVLEWAKEYSKGKFHALLSDPPYHLQSPSSKSGSQPGIESPFGRHNQGNGKKGFMGQTWDGGDIAFRPETWAALGEHLFDGAFGMAFSASRNWHRLAVAIEDAGFIIHPTIFGWLNGQGFPKATNIAKQLDDGKIWEGHRYGLQALKPAIEPIIVFQKPYGSRPIDDIVSTGAGALNIDAGRISLSNGDDKRLGGNGTWRTDNMAKSDYGEYAGENIASSPLGRWPSNFLLDESTAEQLDLQAGEHPTGEIHRRKGMGYHGSDIIQNSIITSGGDSGGASRFFYNVSNQIDEADPIYYCSKVSKKERNAGLEDRNPHPTLKPVDLSIYLAKLLLPPDEYAPRRILVPFSGVGSEMIGCAKAGWEHIVGIEFDKENDYIEIAEKRIEHWCK